MSIYYGTTKINSISMSLYINRIYKGSDVVYGSGTVSPSPPVATGTWEPFSVARAEIGALSAGAIIDFGSRKFAATYTDNDVNGINLTARSVGISGGRFSMGRTASWSSIGGGVYAADHDFSDYKDVRMFVIDENAASKPKMKVNPAPPADTDAYRFVYNGNWFTVRNSNKGIDNGTIHTQGSDNQSNQRITGFTITNATLKAEINTLLAGVTTGTTAGPWVQLHGSNNVPGVARVVSWNNANGGMTLDGFNGGTIMKYNGNYQEFALCGLPAQSMANGEYMVDLTNGITAGRVLYKPTNGNASDARIPVSDFGFKVGGAGNTFTFSGVSFEGSSARGTAPAIINDNAGASGIDISNCSFLDSSFILRNNYTPFSVDKCIIKRAFTRGGALTDGATMTNNLVSAIESFSGFLIQCQSGITAISHTYVANNIMSLEATTHGQGLSLYKDAWRNATVIHNIFYNCVRAHSFQTDTAFTPASTPYPGGGTGDKRGRPASEAYDYKFENNLSVIEKVLDIDGFSSGQTTIAFNGIVDLGLSGSNFAQKVYVRNNTILSSDLIPTTFNLTSRAQVSAIDILKIEHSNVIVDNNIAGNINASAAGSANGGHTHANNLNTLYKGTNAISVTDKLVHTNISDYLEPNTFQGKTVAGGASDGGVLGIRWSNVPTSTQIQNIINNDDVNWASTYSALSLPTGASYSNVLDSTLAYGITGGGTGEFGVWSASNASWASSTPVYATGAVVMGASGWRPGAHGANCSPRYTGGLIMFTWSFPTSAEKTTFIDGVSGDYFRLQVTVTKGGSGSTGDYYAGNTGQVYNYHWPPATIDSFTGTSARWKVSGLSAGGDPWPTSGITGSLWGDFPLYSVAFQPTAF